MYSLVTAENALIAIRKKLSTLGQFPEANPIFHKTENRAIVYRYTIAKKTHRIIFTVERSDGQVIVTRIVHAKQDTAALKRQLEEE